MFKCHAENVVFASSNDNGVGLYEYSLENDLGKDPICINESINSTDFYNYFQHIKVSETECDSSRVIIEFDDKTGYYIILIYYNNTVMKIKKNNRESCLKLSGEIVNSDHITSINGDHISKICISICIIMILTKSGKLYLLNNFDSDKSYDLSKIQICHTEKIVDIDCNYIEDIFLTETGKLVNAVYYHCSNDGKLYHILVNIDSEVDTFKCLRNKVVYKKNNGEFYVTNPNRKISQFDNLRIVNFECSDYYIIAQDDDDNLYAVRVSYYNSFSDTVKINRKVQSVSNRFKTTKSANKKY